MCVIFSDWFLFHWELPENVKIIELPHSTAPILLPLLLVIFLPPPLLFSFPGSSSSSFSSSSSLKSCSGLLCVGFLLSAGVCGWTCVFDWFCVFIWGRAGVISLLSSLESWLADCAEEWDARWHGGCGPEHEEVTEWLKCGAAMHSAVERSQTHCSQSQTLTPEPATYTRHNH